MTVARKVSRPSLGLFCVRLERYIIPRCIYIDGAECLP
jgi:hypothetical protein